MQNKIAVIWGTSAGLVLLAAIALTVAAGFEYIFALFYARTVAADMEAILGLPPLLVKSIYYFIATGTVLLWWATMRWRRSATNASTAKNFHWWRRFDAFMFLATLFCPAIYYLILHNLALDRNFETQKGVALKCFVVTGEAVLLRDAVTPGQRHIDQETGRDCLPLTAEVWPRLKKLQEYRAKGIQPTPIKPAPENFFSAITGEPLLWYYASGQDLRFYEVPGFDRFTGHPLKPVDVTIASLWAQKREHSAVPKDAPRKAESAISDSRPNEAKTPSEQQPLLYGCWKGQKTVRRDGSQDTNTCTVHYAASRLVQWCPAGTGLISVVRIENLTASGYSFTPLYTIPPVSDQGRSSVDEFTIGGSALRIKRWASNRSFSWDIYYERVPQVECANFVAQVK